MGVALAIRAALIGIGATVVMDVWGVVASGLFKFPVPNYGMIGRWIGHMPGGRFAHESIARATPVPGEHAIGWLAHYGIGIGFAFLLVSITGGDWVDKPTPLPAVVVGLVTVGAPFFVMQPAMGAGIASSRAPNPNAARLRSILNHLWFGVGLYGAALVVSMR